MVVRMQNGLAAMKFRAVSSSLGATFFSARSLGA
jgi:hypothetical protein